MSGRINPAKSTIGLPQQHGCVGMQLRHDRYDDNDKRQQHRSLHSFPPTFPENTEHLIMLLVVLRFYWMIRQIWLMTDGHVHKAERASTSGPKECCWVRHRSMESGCP